MVGGRPRVLFGLLYGIGDVICATPALRAIRTRWPEAEVHVLLGRGNEGLVEGLGLVDQFLPYRTGDVKGMGEWWRFGQSLHKNRYDAVFATAQSRTWKMPFLAKATGAPVRIGNAAEPGSWLYTLRVSLPGNYHYVQRELAIVGAGGIPPLEEIRCEVAVGEPEREWARNFLAGKGWAEVITLCSGADPVGRGRWLPDLKRWPAEHWRELVTHLTSQGRKVVVLGGAEERSFGKYLVSAAPGAVISGVGEWTLRQSVAMLSLCRCLVVNDTGMAHVAGALDVPQVALFGPTDAAVCGPWKAQVKVIQGKSLPCAPCFPEPVCGKERCEVMKGVELGRVEREIRALFLGK